MAMVEVSDDWIRSTMYDLLGQDFAVEDRLDGGVIGVFVNIAAEECLDFGVLLWSDVLVGNGRVDDLCDCGIMLSSSSQMLLYCCLGFLHVRSLVGL